MTTLADRLLPDGLWQRLHPLLPLAPSHARGGAPRTVSDRACMAAIIFMARTSTPWAPLPVGEFGCGSVTTCWRRFAEWASAGVFERLQELLLDELGEAGQLDWSRVIADGVAVRQLGADLGLGSAPTPAMRLSRSSPASPRVPSTAPYTSTEGAAAGSPVAFSVRSAASSSGPWGAQRCQAATTAAACRYDQTRWKLVMRWAGRGAKVKQ